MEKELTMTMHIPVRVRMTVLTEDGEGAFVDQCMATPGACDNDLGDAGNRAWFANIWRQQVRFQQLLLSNSDHMAQFMGYLLAEEITHRELLRLKVGELEGVIEGAAQELEAEEHFFPAASLGLGSYDMLAQVVDACAVDIEQPIIDVG